MRVSTGGSSCYGASALNGCYDLITPNLYGAAQTGELRQVAVLADASKVLVTVLPPSLIVWQSAGCWPPLA